MEQSNHKKLIEEILKLSNSDNKDTAIKEWSLKTIFREENNCLCGHEIMDNCFLINRINGNTAIVGNVCVNKFLGLDYNGLFIGLKRIYDDESKCVSKKLINYMYEKGGINDWEKDFYLNIFNKRLLTINQLNKKIDINKKILNFFKRGKK